MIILVVNTECIAYDTCKLASPLNYILKLHFQYVSGFEKFFLIQYGSDFISLVTVVMLLQVARNFSEASYIAVIDPLCIVSLC